MNHCTVHRYRSMASPLFPGVGGMYVLQLPALLTSGRGTAGVGGVLLIVPRYSGSTVRCASSCKVLS